jgi:hypothetical protein
MISRSMKSRTGILCIQIVHQVFQGNLIHLFALAGLAVSIWAGAQSTVHHINVRRAIKKAVKITLTGYTDKNNIHKTILTLEFRQN